MAKWRKRPVEIEAEQWNGGAGQRGVCMKGHGLIMSNDVQPHLHTIHDGQAVFLESGDWIMPEPDGEHFYPCKADIFAATYEPAEGESIEDLARRLIASKHFIPTGNGGDYMSWDILAEDELRERLGMARS